MRSVTRHQVDTAAADQDLKILGPGIRKLPLLIERSPEGRGFNVAVSRSLEELGYRSVSDPKAVQIDTWNAAVRAMQSSTALFIAASRTDGDVEFRFGEDTLRRAATGPTMDSTGLNWLTALWLAMICRERPRIDLLTSIPIDLLRASSPLDEFVYVWVRTLQTYWTRGGENLVDKLLEAMRGTDPGRLEHLSEETVLQLYYPPVELFYHLTQRDDARFNESLANALELHKRYWSGEVDRRRSPDGFVALGPLAIACLARDVGVSIEVESDYLPQRLLEGTWVGEHST